MIGKINTICKFKENVIPYRIKITQGKKLLPAKEALRKIRDMNWEKIQQFLKSEKTGGIGNEGTFPPTSNTWQSSERKKGITAAISAALIVAAGIGLNKILHNEPCKHLDSNKIPKQPIEKSHVNQIVQLIQKLPSMTNASSEFLVQHFSQSPQNPPSTNQSGQAAILSQDSRFSPSVFQRQGLSPKVFPQTHNPLQAFSRQQPVFPPQVAQPANLPEKIKESQKLQNDKSENLRLSSEVDVEKYKAANPDLLSLIPDNIEVKEEKKLGSGAQGTVYPTNNDNYLVKVYGDGDYFSRSRQNEIQAGNIFREGYENIGKNTQISDIQGFFRMAPGKQFQGDKLIMERINGYDLQRCIDENLPPFSNGYIDNPQEAIERVCGLLAVLQFLKQMKRTHGDLNPKNIIVEELKLSDKEKRYAFRLVDYGNCHIPISTNDTDDDLFIKLLPILLFGKSGKEAEILPDYQKILSIDSKQRISGYPEERLCIKFLKNFQEKMVEELKNDKYEKNQLISKLKFYTTELKEKELEKQTITRTKKTDNKSQYDELENLSQELRQKIKNVNDSLWQIWKNCPEENEKIKQIQNESINKKNSFWNECFSSPDILKGIQDNQNVYANYLFQEWLRSSGKTQQTQNEFMNQQNLLWNECFSSPDILRAIQDNQNVYANYLFQEWFRSSGKDQQMQVEVSNSYNGLFEKWLQDSQKFYEKNIEQGELKEAMVQYTLEEYKKINVKMKNDKKISYPEPLLGKIVEVVSKFANENLPIDELLFEFQNFAYSDWNNTKNSYKIEGASEWKLPTR